MSIPPQLLQIGAQLLLNGIQSGIQQVNDQYQKALEAKKQIQDIYMQELQKDKEAKKQIFDKLTESKREEAQEAQETFGSAWKKALDASSDSQSQDQQ
jgi:CHASE3 domain sensor protein